MILLRQLQCGGRGEKNLGTSKIARLCFVAKIILATTHTLAILEVTDIIISHRQFTVTTFGR